MLLPDLKAHRAKVDCQAGASLHKACLNQPDPCNTSAMHMFTSCKKALHHFGVLQSLCMTHHLAHMQHCHASPFICSDSASGSNFASCRLHMGDCTLCRMLLEHAQNAAVHDKSWDHLGVVQGFVTNHSDITHKKLCCMGLYMQKS